MTGHMRSGWLGLAGRRVALPRGLKIHKIMTRSLDHLAGLDFQEADSDMEGRDRSWSRPWPSEPARLPTQACLSYYPSKVNQPSKSDMCVWDKEYPRRSGVGL